MDLNLLPVLRALLEEESVTRAAERLHLSVPTASRALARCRRLTGDPLLVRRGRGVVATRRGAELARAVGALLDELETVLGPPAAFEPAELERTFVIRSNEVVMAAIGTGLVDAALARTAPGVDVRFELETPDDIAELAGGHVDLAIGSYGDTSGEIATLHLGDETMVGVVRSAHPALARRVTPGAYARLGHIVVARRGRAWGPIDEQLAARGLRRAVAAVVPSFTAALAMVAGTDLTTICPRRHLALLGAAVTELPVPVVLPSVPIDALWHERNAADPAHRWLRERVLETAVADVVGRDENPLPGERRVTPVRAGRRASVR